VPDKENTKYFTGAKKCGGEKIAQRRLRRLQFFGAQNARTGHFAVTVCYAMVAIYAIIFNFIIYHLYLYL
jgi:hypothetical protein